MAGEEKKPGLATEPLLGDDDDDEDAAIRHAAEGPTAVWDTDSLRAAGLGPLFDQHGSQPPPPATAPAAAQSDKSSIEVDGGLGATPGPTSPRRDVTGDTDPPIGRGGGGGLSWVSTLLIAIAIGVAVYFAIRYLK